MLFRERLARKYNYKGFFDPDLDEDLNSDRRIFIEALANVPSDTELLLDSINDRLLKILEIMSALLSAPEKKQSQFNGLINHNKKRIFHEAK